MLIGRAAVVDQLDGQWTGGGLDRRRRRPQRERHGLVLHLQRAGGRRRLHVDERMQRELQLRLHLEQTLLLGASRGARQLAEVFAPLLLHVRLARTVHGQRLGRHGVLGVRPVRRLGHRVGDALQVALTGALSLRWLAAARGRALLHGRLLCHRRRLENRERQRLLDALRLEHPLHHLLHHRRRLAREGRAAALDLQRWARR